MAVEQAIAGVVGGWPPFAVATGDGGGFLGERGGVCWLELGEGRTQATELALTLDTALGSRAYEGRPPRPHLTLARRVTPELLAEVHRVDTLLRTRWLIDKAVLYRSHPGPGSAQYEALSTIALANL